MSRRMQPIRGRADREARLASLTPEQWRQLAERLIPACSLLVDGWLALNVSPANEDSKDSAR